MNPVPLEPIPTNRRAVRGLVLHPVSDTQCEVWTDGVLLAAANEAGDWQIVAAGPALEVIATHLVQPAEIEPVSGVILPPFFDLHFHWVQDAVRTMPKDSLLEWLRDYTFPTEARFADAEYAEAEAMRFWARILATGTIGGCCYSSVHEGALHAAMRYAGPYFKIGNVLMTMNSPGELRQTEAAASSLVDQLARQYGPRYLASPRFAPTTGPEVMRASAKAATTHGTFQQTHLCETPAEIAWVTSMYREMPGWEDITSYTEIYDRVGLLGPRTVMGHCIHLTDAEWARLAQTQTIIASCPTSNAPLDQRGLGSGLFDWQRADAEGVPWALASDIGGGPFLSMLDVMQSFITQNRDAGIIGATGVRALYRSTQAGADRLELGDQMGNFAPGKAFNYLVLPLATAPTENGPEAVIEALLAPHRATRENYDTSVARTVVNGQIVFSA